MCHNLRNAIRHYLANWLKMCCKLFSASTFHHILSLFIDLLMMLRCQIITMIARFMGPSWDLSGADRVQVGPIWPHEFCYLGTTRMIFRILVILHPMHQPPVHIKIIQVCSHCTNCVFCPFWQNITHVIASYTCKYRSWFCKALEFQSCGMRWIWFVLYATIAFLFRKVYLELFLLKHHVLKHESYMRAIFYNIISSRF